MATTTSHLRPTNGARLRLLTFPREHGAWGLLLVPLTTGAAAGRFTTAAISPLILFTLAALALFCARTPLESWLATSPIRPRTPVERRAVLSSIAGFAVVAATAIGALLWLERAWRLVVLGPIVAAIFLAQALLKTLGRTRLAAQMVGSLGLASTAAASYYVVTQKFDATALVLWGVNWLFAANQIHFVQLRIRAAHVATRAEKWMRGRAFLTGEILTLVLLLLGWRLGRLPALAILAFLPILLRGAAWLLSPRMEPLQVHRLGLSELKHAIAFGVFLIIAFHFGKV